MHVFFLVLGSGGCIPHPTSGRTGCSFRLHCTSSEGFLSSPGDFFLSWTGKEKRRGTEDRCAHIYCATTFDPKVCASFFPAFRSTGVFSAAVFFRKGVLSRDQIYRPRPVVCRCIFEVVTSAHDLYI